MELRYSVIVPVYNVKRYLISCVESILGQKSKYGIEIILVDDGSTDGSEEICDKLCGQHPEIVRVFHNSNHGLLYTRRYGYSMSRGEYIVNCDSDDILEDCFFTTLDNIIDKSKLDTIIFNMNLYDGENKEPLTKNIFKNEGAITKKEVISEFLSANNIISLCTKVYRSSCIDKCDLYEEFGRFNNAEDSLQSIEVYHNSDKYAYINRPLYNYRVSSGMTNRFDPKYINNFVIVISRMDIFKEYLSTDEYDRLISQKALTILGRAITQLRYDKNGCWSDQKEYLGILREQKAIIHYESFLRENRPKLEKSYYYWLIKWFLKGRYSLIILALRIRNILG